MLDSLKKLLRGEPPPASVAAPQPATRDEALRAAADGFWRNWFANRGADYRNDYRARMDANLPLNVELAQFAEKIAKDEIDILDVGAGPASVVGRTMPGKMVRLVAIDVAAEAYDRLVAEFEAPVPVRTTFGDAERLPEPFGPASFDIVFAQNAIDHSERPLLAIDGMIAVCRPGGLVFLRHQEYEGRANGYGPLNQWDFFLDDATQHFKIRHAGGEEHDVTERTRDLGASRVYRVGKRFVWEFAKR